MDPARGLSPTLLVGGDELVAERVVVEGEAYRHLFRARRLARDVRLRLTDGKGRARWAEVIELERHRAVLRPLGEAPSNDPTRHVELLLGMPRAERAAWLVEKAAELGVAAVRFLAADRAVRGVDAKALARLHRVAQAALEQCGGARLPELTGPHELAAVPTLLEAAATAWVLDPARPERNPGGRARLAGQPWTGDGSVLVLIGPEGGWTAAELASFESLGIRRAALGERTLRVETAALAAAALLLLPG